MSKVVLTAEEIDVLRAALVHFVVKDRTGELGILHGMDRFVSTHTCLRKAERQTLETAFRKLGLSLKIMNL